MYKNPLFCKYYFIKHYILGHCELLNSTSKCILNPDKYNTSFNTLMCNGFFKFVLKYESCLLL